VTFPLLGGNNTFSVATTFIDGTDYYTTTTRGASVAAAYAYEIGTRDITATQTGGGPGVNPATTGVSLSWMANTGETYEVFKIRVDSAGGVSSAVLSAWTSVAISATVPAAITVDGTWVTASETTSLAASIPPAGQEHYYQYIIIATRTADGKKSAPSFGGISTETIYGAPTP